MIDFDGCIYQIAYDESSWLKVRESGCLVLDNMSNERPDWFEYWPIRKFILENDLDDERWYGFFSPRFQEKTGLNASGVAKIIQDIESKSKAVDVILFSPQPDMGAYFINVFEQGEMFHPGHMDIAKETLASIGIDVPIEAMVMDSRQVVFSNYFVAKPAFWKRWFEITENIFDMAENRDHPLYDKLNGGTSYRNGSHQKIFLIERIASLILTMEKGWKSVSADTFSFAWSAFPSFNANRQLAYQSDALKMAFRESGYAHYMEAYQAIRKKIGET